MGIISKIKNIVKSILGMTNNRDVFFTKDFFKDKKYDIGHYSYGKPTVLYENDNANLFIGKFCSIASGVVIFLGGNHRHDWVSTYPFNVLTNYFPEADSITGHPSTKGDVVIKNDVWIGNDVTIMSGVTIGNGAVIAAKSVVTRDVGDYEIVAGNPARFVKKRFDNEIVNQLLEQKWWDKDIDEIRQICKQLCSEPKVK